MPDRLDPSDPAEIRHEHPERNDLIKSGSETSSENVSQVLWRVFSMRFLRGALTAVIVLALILYFGVAATALALRFVVMPRIDSFRPNIEAAASEALGAQVSIVALSAHWQGLSPDIEIFGLTVRNTHGTVALSVPHASAVAAWRSLVRFKPLLTSLQIEHPDVLAIRHADGTFEIAGVPLKIGGGNKNQLAHWLFTQDVIVLRGGTLHWQDETRSAPNLTVHNIKLAVFNFGHAHRVGIQADGDGMVLRGPLDFRANFRNGVLADPGAADGWLGRAYLKTGALDLPSLSNYLNLPIEAVQGQVSGSATFAFAQMKLTSVQGELSGNSLLLRANPQLPLIDSPSASLHFDLRHNDNVYQLGVRNLSMTLADETPLSDGTPVDRLLTVNQFDAVYKNPITGHGQIFSIKGDLADVGLLAGLSRKLPLPRSLIDQLTTFDPRGVIRNYTVAWERAAPSAGAPSSAAVAGDSEANGNAPVIHFQLKAALDNLSIAPQMPPAGLTSQGHKRVGLPGFDNLSGVLETTEKKGTLTLDSHHSAVTIPGLLDAPQIDFDALSGHINWVIGQNSGHSSGQNGTQRTIAVHVADLALDNANLSATTQVDYANDGTGRGTLDLLSHIDQMNLTAVARYLPSSLNQDLRDYLGHALRSGTAHDATIQVQGKLEDFPFSRKDKPGIFHIVAPFIDGSFDPTPVPAVLMGNGRAQQWPPLEQISGTFELNREKLDVTVADARYKNVMLTNVRAHIDDLSTPNNPLIVAGGGEGPVGDLLAYIDASPVSFWTGHIVDKLNGRGPAALALRLELPREKGGQTHVSGTVGLRGDTLNYPVGPALSQTTGQLQFTEHSLTLQRITGQFLGDTLNAQGGINPDGTIAATVSGRLNAAVLRGELSQDTLGRLAGKLSGTAAYSVSFRAAHPGLPEITGNADLSGLAIDLPAPLGKAQGAEMPLRFEIRPQGMDNNPGAMGAEATNTTHVKGTFIPLPVKPPLTQIEAQIGPVSLAYLVHAGDNADMRPSEPATWAAPVVVKGAIGINRPAVMPAHGVIAAVTLNTLDLDAWRTALAQLFPAAPAVPLAKTAGSDTVNSTAAGPTGSPASGPGNTMADFLPTQLKAHISSLDLLARTWDNVNLEGSHLSDAWQAEISSDQLAGRLAWHPQSTLSAAGAFEAHLSKLVIPPQHEGTPLMQTLRTQPHLLPAVDVVIDDFTASNHAIGKFELQARNLQRDGVPVWQIDQLKISNPAAKLSATGNWRLAAGEPAPDAPGTPDPGSRPSAAQPTATDPRRTELDFKLDISDGGALLNRLGLPRTLKDGKGLLAGHIDWRGSPDTIDAPTLAGNLSLDLRHGQILKVDPGIGKLLGVLSLQSLVRFITFDFRGVVGSGLAFDSITASSKIAQGVARSDDFKINSSVAHVAIQGSADIPHETQNLEVTVVPTLSASSAALAATVVNPLLGLSTFVAQLVLSDSLSKALAVEYSVTGSWAAPEIRQIKGKDSKTPFTNPARSADPSGPVAAAGQ